MTFARIHRRLDWPANRILCLVLRAFWSIMFQQKCAFWDTSGFQEVLPWPSTLRKVQYRQCTRSQKIHWTLMTQEMREDLQIDFSQETFFGFFFGTLTWNVSIQSPPPPKKIDFFSDWVGLFEICFRSSKMTDPRPCPTGWAYFKTLSRSTKTCRLYREIGPTE